MKAEQGREATERVSSRASRLFWFDGRWVLSASKSSRRSTRSAEERVAISARREERGLQLMRARRIGDRSPGVPESEVVTTREELGMRSTVNTLYTVSTSSGTRRHAYRLLPQPPGFLCGGDGGGDLRIHDEQEGAKGL
jgi:hypothetical protein